jgi:hypothetical protein
MLKFLNTFKGIAQAQLGTGDTTLFWQDLWNGRLLQHEYPELHSFAINKNITVKKMLQSEAIEDNFHPPYQK